MVGAARFGAEMVVITMRKSARQTAAEISTTNADLRIAVIGVGPSRQPA